MHALAILLESTAKTLLIRPALQLCPARALAPLSVFELFGSWLEPPWNCLGRCLWTEAKLPPTYVYKTKKKTAHLFATFSVLLFTCVCGAVESVH